MTYWYLYPFTYLGACVLLWWAVRWLLLTIHKRRSFTYYGRPYGSRECDQARPNTRRAS